MNELGRRTPSIETLVQKSRIFNVSVDYLITGSEFNPKTRTTDKHISFPR